VADVKQLVRGVGVVRIGADGSAESRADEVAVEEPLELRVSGDTLAITMRTPGHDRELALGFLLSEGIIRSLADVGALIPCGVPGEASWGNVLDVRPAPGTALVLPGELGKRGTLTTAACGVCGRASIEDLLARCSVIPKGAPLPAAALLAAVAALSQHQPGFARSGGLHAALATDRAGRVLAAAEDVGRHNAVDKVAGALLLSGNRAQILAVSGRISFEIVQKAVASSIGVVCGVSAPTSLAIELAERCAVVLAGFVRGDALGLYAHADRIEP
jgi:FdhD protein